MIKLTIMIPNYNQENLLLRALDSIPKRDDIEVLIIDDASTDDSLNIINKWITDNNKYFGNLVVKVNEENMGCGYGKNWAYSTAQGEYIITLDSDDYLYTDEYNKVINMLYNLDYDMIFIDNDINSGERWGGTWKRCATWSYFVKNKFLKDHNLNYRKDARRAGDLHLKAESEKNNPRIYVLNNLLYHYNYPRKGSIVWNWEHNGKRKS